MTSPEDLPPIPPEDPAVAFTRLADSIDHLFPGNPEARTRPVDVAIGIMTQYALDLVTSDHIVEIAEDGSWSAFHPFSCRALGDQCPLHQWMVERFKQASEGEQVLPVSGPGVYQVLPVIVPDHDPDWAFLAQP